MEAARWKVTAVQKALGTNQQHASLQQVVALVADGNPKGITHVTKEDLEVACLNEACQRFTQAAGLTLQCCKNLYFHSWETTLKSTTFQQVLDGTFQCPESCNVYTKKVLKQLARPPQVVEIPGWTFEEYRWGWAIA